jgi:hypothetical protein
MFGLFGPKCPLGTREKTWVEWRMRWLAERFSVARMRRVPVILPTNEFFPDKLAGHRDGARECFERMCMYMEIDPATVNLEFIADENMPNAAGLYQMRERSNICVAESQIAAPHRLLATLAHELAHELLLKGGHLTQHVADHEHVTDLLPVFLGVGIFVANATVEFLSESTASTHRWSISRQGYLNSIVLGYALAVFAYVRGEDRPAWGGHLRGDAAEPLWAGLRYLRKTGDCLFGPETEDGPRACSTPAQVIERLSHRSPTFRLAALWDVGQIGVVSEELLTAVLKCLADKDADVRREAVRSLGLFGATAARALPQVIEAARHGSPADRVAALRTLGEIRTAPDEVFPLLTAALTDEVSEIACAAAQALAQFGPAAAAAEPHLLAAMEASALIDGTRFACLVAAIRTVSPDPKASIRAHFAGSDGEARRLALGVLKDQGG